VIRLGRLLSLLLGSAPLLLVGASLFLAGAGGAWAQADPSLVEKLRQGGYVLYMRHASTDFSQNDEKSRSFEDCKNQRNLTDKGRAEARAVGEHIKRLKVPVGTVLASPYCRTMETARLAFGKATPMPEVRGGPLASEDPKRYEGLRKILSASVPKGENLAVSSHANPFRAVTGLPYLAEGEIAVVQPEGDGRFSVVGRILLEEWPASRSTRD
jgi:phosphohistidine phosphatase SixA